MTRGRTTPPQRDWRTLLDYGALFRPWIQGRAAPEGPPLTMAQVAPLRAFTERYGTSTALAWALQGRALAPDAHSYATLALLYGRAKAARQLDGLRAVVLAMNAAGAVPLLLKGSAAQVGGLYPDPGFRLMADIDLIVPPERFAPCVAAAERAGFAIVPKEPGKDAGHALQQFDAARGLLLEVHSRITRVYERDNFPASALFEAAREAPFAGGRVLLPDWSHHAALTILHAVAWDRSRYMALVPVKALLDLAALRRSGAPISWEAVRQHLERAGERGSLLHIEVLFRALFGVPLTDIPVGRAQEGRILAYYALGNRFPVAQRLGLAWNQVRKRVGRARRDPSRLLQLARPSFYWHLLADTRGAFDPKTPLN